jgi:hypothetical protein
VQEVERDEVFEIDGRVAQLIGEAALAGAYAEIIKRIPETAAGFGKLAAKHRARVAAVADEIARSASRDGSALDALAPKTR